jgi:hypothetical protein
VSLAGAVPTIPGIWLPHHDLARPATALDTIEERDANMLYFIPNSRHLALRDMPDVHCGLEGETGTMIAIERAFRDANLIKREWKCRTCRASRRARLKVSGLSGTIEQRP